MGFQRLERVLRSCFRKYGDLLSRHPLPFILIPFVATLILTPFLFLFATYNDNVISLCTPYNAPSRHELYVYNHFQSSLPLDSPDHSIDSGSSEFDPEAGVAINPGGKNGYFLQLDTDHSVASLSFFVGAAYKNRSNIMTVATWKAMRELFEYIYLNYTCQVEESEGRYRTLHYMPDFCAEDDEVQCPPLHKYMRKMEDLVNNTENGGSSRIVTTYPIMYAWGVPVNLGQFVFGADVNGSGYLQSAKMAMLKMDVKYNLTRIPTHAARQCMMNLWYFILQYRAPEAGDLKFYVNGEWFQNEQVSATKTKLLPFIPVTAILVTLFTLIFSYYSRAPLVGALEALLGMVTIGLSMISSFAILFVCGIPFNFAVTMTPFLTLCVGIDNDFLLMASWRKPSVAKLPAKRRLAAAFVDAGPNLTITSLNDILCFAVGILSESPAISHFCLYTGVALSFRFLYQLTFFSGALVYADRYGHVTERWIKGMCWTRRMKTNLKGIWWVETKKKDSTAPVLIHVPDEIEEHIVHRFFRVHYSSILSWKWIRALVTCAFASYLIFSFVYASKLKVDVSLQKLVYDESPSQEYYMLLQKYILKTQIGQVIVTNAPDFRQEENVHRFMEFVDSLEKTNYSNSNKQTTSLWLRDYLDFSSYLAEAGDDFYKYLPDFFASSPENAKYAGDLRFNYSQDGNLTLQSFQFTTYYENVLTWDDSAKLMLLWRRICQNYSDYGAIVQDYFTRNAYLDQSLTLSGNTLQTMGIASLMIALVTALMMPDLASMFFICFSSLSVDLGVIGLLNLWGSDLDPVTTACLLMTIGFSVYYTARMCYCYQRAGKGLKTREKLSDTLGAVGWPILQGGLGTWLGIIPLVFVHGYMTRTFFRTIFLVVAIGLCHGLLFMPVMMSLYDFVNPPFRKMRRMR